MTGQHPQFSLTLQDITDQSRDAEILGRWSQASRGLVILAGSKGSGKTTTAYCCMAQVAGTPNIKACTIEDELSMRLEGVEQRLMDSDAGISGDHDVEAMVDSGMDALFINGPPTYWSPALRAAKSGRLVFVQLEAGSATQALELFGRATQCKIDEILVGVVWQKLSKDPVNGSRRAQYTFIPGSLDPKTSSS